MSEMVHITINKQPLEVPAGTRIIEAAKMLNIDIPHLCYHPDQTIKAHCRMCMVEVVGSRKLTAACSTVVWEGMEVITDSKKVYDAQTGVLDLILSDHKTNCLSCARNGSCELQALCRRFNRLHPELPDISSDEPLRIDNRPRPRQVRQVRPLREGVRRGPGLRRPDLLRPLRRLQGHHRL
mgnify:CR=1 FL=1